MSYPFLKQSEGNSFKAHGGEERNMEATLSKQLFQSNLRATSTAGGEETGAEGEAVGVVVGAGTGGEFVGAGKDGELTGTGAGGRGYRHQSHWG